MIASGRLPVNRCPRPELHTIHPWCPCEMKLTARDDAAGVRAPVIDMPSKHLRNDVRRVAGRSPAEPWRDFLATLATALDTPIRTHTGQG